jgi:peroxiredoxin
MDMLAPDAPAPDFTLTGADGRVYSLRDALQKGPVLLAFFKQGCPTCQFTLPFLERIHQGIKDGSGPQLWGISQDDASATQALAQEAGLTFPLLPDENGYPVSNEYGLTHVPTLFLVEPDGAIRANSTGFDRKQLQAVAARFSELQNEPIIAFRPGEQIPDYKAG